MSEQTQPVPAVTPVALTDLKFVDATVPLRSRIYDVESKIVDAEIDLTYWQQKSAQENDPEIMKSLQRTKQAIKDLNAMYVILKSKFEELGGVYKDESTEETTESETATPAA